MFPDVRWAQQLLSLVETQTLVTHFRDDDILENVSNGLLKGTEDQWILGEEGVSLTPQAPPPSRDLTQPR